MRVDLTKSVIDSLVCPASKRDALFFDAKLACFALRVTESGSKIFLVQYSRKGQTKRITIGRFGVITAAEARRKAFALIGEIQAGGDPLAQRENARAAAAAAEAQSERDRAARREADAFTVEILLSRWVQIKLKDRSASYQREGPAAVRRLLGEELVDAPAQSIKTAALQAIVDREITRAPAQTVDARACGRAAWNWAIKRGLVKENPFAEVVIEHRVKSRDRVLDDAELADVWRAAGAKPYPFGPLVQLMILTLQRRSEVAGMGWSELSPDGLTWTIPAIRAKNRRAHIVHLAEPARNIIAHLRRRHEAVSAEMAATGSKAPVTDLIFTTTGQTAVSGMSKARRALDPEATEGAEADIGERRSHEGTINAGPDKKTGGAATATDWRFHDFRRTGVSKMAELGIPPHVADRVLNHVSGSIQGVAAVYQRFEFLQERKHAMDVWASHVLSISADKALASNVFPMKRSL